MILGEVLKNSGVLQEVGGYGYLATLIQNEGVSHISTLRRLTVLNLSGIFITDDGVKSICSISSLEKLDLSFCCLITDVSLTYLRSLEHLKLLNLYQCARLSLKAVEEFKMHLVSSGLQAL